VAGGASERTVGRKWIVCEAGFGGKTADRQVKVVGGRGRRLSRFRGLDRQGPREDRSAGRDCDSVAEMADTGMVSCLDCWTLQRQQCQPCGDAVL
jgi:hypothetical protein